MTPVDYPPYLVEAVLTYWDEVQSVKLKITPTLVANNYASVKEEDFYLKEGNTLLSKGSKTTRVAHNSNRRIEALSDITSDIEVARRSLTMFENVALMAYFQGIEVSPEIKTVAYAAFEKVVKALNAH